MKNKYPIVLLICLCFKLLDAEDELPEAKIKVQLKIATNYISKGTDKFTNRALQKKQSYGANTGAPAFIPAITYLPPLKGTFYKIQAFIALEGRPDLDADGFIQNGPGQKDILHETGGLDQQIQAIKNASGLFDSTDQFIGINNALNGSLSYPDCKSTSNCLPKLHKEENGLFRQEQIKQFLGYGRKTSMGKFLFSLLYVTPFDKKAELDAFPAFIIEYSLPGLDQLILSTEHDIPKSGNYYQLKWVDKQSLGNLDDSDLMLEYWAGVAYSVQDHLQGVKDVTGRIGLQYLGFRIGAGLTWRPDLRFFDKDSTGIGGDSLPLWLFGNSSRSDGRVADPSRLYGYENVIINNAIESFLQAGGSASIYTYTPRQKIPRILYWVDLSYTFTLQ